MPVIQHPFPVTAVPLVLQTSPSGLVFEAGLSLEEQDDHLQIEMREKVRVRDGLQHLVKAL